LTFKIGNNNVFIGEFIDRTFHAVERVRARASLEIYWCSSGEVRPAVKNHWIFVWCSYSFKHFK